MTFMNMHIVLYFKIIKIDTLKVGGMLLSASELKTLNLGKEELIWRWEGQQ